MLDYGTIEHNNVVTDPALCHLPADGLILPLRVQSALHSLVEVVQKHLVRDCWSRCIVNEILWQSHLTLRLSWKLGHTDFNRCNDLVTIWIYRGFQLALLSHKVGSDANNFRTALSRLLGCCNVWQFGAHHAAAALAFLASLVL